MNNVPVDVSGQTHVWLKAVKKLGVEPKWLSHLSSLKWGMDELDIQISRKVLDFIIHDDRNLDKKFYTELYDYKFLHFRAGSNWKKEPSEIVRKRNQNFLNAISELN